MRDWGTHLNPNGLNVCIPVICLSVARKIDHTRRNLIYRTRLSAMKEWLLQQHLINLFHSGKAFSFFSDKPSPWCWISYSRLVSVICSVLHVVNNKTGLVSKMLHSVANYVMWHKPIHHNERKYVRDMWVSLKSFL